MLPQDGYSASNNHELIGALGDHAIDVELELLIVYDSVIIVANNSRAAHVDEVWYERLLGGRRGITV